MIEDDVINDFSAAILLRHLKGLNNITSSRPRLDTLRDMELLHFHWSFSAPVRNLAAYLLENRHETQTLLVSERQISDSIIRGRMDAKETILLRLKSGMPTSTVYYEAKRTFLSGNNQVLAWVLSQATQISFRFSKRNELGTAYNERLNQSLSLLNQVKRIEVIQSFTNKGIQRPVAAALSSTQRSRNKLYRLAHDAYRLYLEIERGDQNAIASMLEDTLLGPLENWRRLELAVGLGIGEALSSAIGQPLNLLLLGMEPKKPIAQCGKYSIYWQTHTSLYKSPHLEPSEAISANILKSYGLNSSTDRPDLLVIDEEYQVLVSIVEVKYHAGDNPVARFREAVNQIVRYSRGYEGQQDLILNRSAIAMNVGGLIKKDFTIPSPFFFSFDDIVKNQLVTWIQSTWLTDLK